MQTKGPLHTWPAKANIGRKQTIAENKSLRKTNHCRSLTTASTASFVRKFGRVTIPSLGEVRHRVYWFSLKIKWTSANKRQADFLNKLPIIWLTKAKKENCFPDKGLPATSHQFGEVRRGWIFHLNIFLLSAFECPRTIRWYADVRGDHVYTDFFLILSHSLLTGYCEMLTSPWRSIPPDLFLFSRKEGFLVGKHPKFRWEDEE